jgi:hypothetical protein
MPQADIQTETTPRAPLRALKRHLPSRTPTPARPAACETPAETVAEPAACAAHWAY